MKGEAAQHPQPRGAPTSLTLQQQTQQAAPQRNPRAPMDAPQSSMLPPALTSPGVCLGSALCALGAVVGLNSAVQGWKAHGELGVPCGVPASHTTSFPAPVNSERGCSLLSQGER